MARGVSLLILTFAFAPAAECFAQETPAAQLPAAATPAPLPKAKPEIGKPLRKDRAFPGGGVDAEKAREAFRNMSPEERERWLRRFRDWADMPPEKKKSLADREEVLRRRMREDIESAQKEVGLEFNEEQKKAFAQRYIEERRKIEEELRRETEASRRPKVKALVEKLREEFTASSKEQ